MAKITSTPKYHRCWEATTVEQPDDIRMTQERPQPCVSDGKDDKLRKAVYSFAAQKSNVALLNYCVFNFQMNAEDRQLLLMEIRKHEVLNFEELYALLQQYDYKTMKERKKLPILFLLSSPQPQTYNEFERVVEKYMDQFSQEASDKRFYILIWYCCDILELNAYKNNCDSWRQLAFQLSHWIANYVSEHFDNTANQDLMTHFRCDYRSLQNESEQFLSRRGIKHENYKKMCQDEAKGDNNNDDPFIASCVFEYYIQLTDLTQLQQDNVEVARVDSTRRSRIRIKNQNQETEFQEEEEVAQGETSTSSPTSSAYGSDGTPLCSCWPIAGTWIAGCALALIGSLTTKT